MFCLGLVLTNNSWLISQNVPLHLYKKYLDSGRLYYFQVQNAPFPHPARENGYSYKNQTYPRSKHYYDNNVAVFLPGRLILEEPVDIVVYFHGWYNHLDSVL
jgi:hypothetical protein